MKTTTTDKDPLIHFPFYINQYQGILSRYSLEEKGAFISLLCVYIIEDSQLPENQDQLFRMCLAFSESERRAILSVKEKVIETGLEILKYQKEKREKCRESARIGGLARVAKAQAIAQETLKRPSSNKETEKQTEIEIKKEIEKEKKLLLESQFESFWESYIPVKTNSGFVKKGSKEQSKIAFAKALKKNSFEKIMAALESYLIYCQQNNRFTKNASSWLKEGDFEITDETCIISKEQSPNLKQTTQDLYNNLANKYENE